MRTSRQRWVRQLGLAALLMAAVVGGIWGYLAVRSSRDLDKAIASLTVQGAPTTWTELLGPPLPESRNAFSLAARAMPQPRDGTLLSGDLEKLMKLLDGDRSVGMEDGRRIVSKLGGQVRELVRASGMPQAQMQLQDGNGSLNDIGICGSLRRGAYLLCAAAVVRHSEGNDPDAAQLMLAAKRLGELLREQPGATNQASRSAIALTVCAAAERVRQMSDAGLRTLWGGLAPNGNAGAGRLVEADIAQVLETVRRLRNDRSVAGRLKRPYAQAMFASYLKFLAGQRELCRLRWREWPEGTRSARQRSWLRPGAVLVEMMRPLLNSRVWQRDLADTYYEGLRLSIALELMKRKTGAYPARLADLWLPAKAGLPQDVFSGEPFRYASTGEGYVFYSVGPNLQDEQGRLRSSTKRLDESGDVVWRSGSWMPRGTR